MLDCLILGDSIAVGTHQTRKECVAIAKGGINSWQFNKNNSGEFYANTVIISLGSNDHKGVNTRKELQDLRARILSKRVFWILPAGNLKAGGVPIETIQLIVQDIAKKNEDIVLPIGRLQPDGIHPNGLGYKELGRLTK